MSTEHPLTVEIGAYELMRAELVAHHNGKFALFHGADFVGAFDTFDNAAREAVRRFGDGPYLIRQVGRETAMPMPASVAYRPLYAAH